MQGDVPGGVQVMQLPLNMPRIKGHFSQILKFAATNLFRIRVECLTDSGYNQHPPLHALPYYILQSNL